MSEVKATHHTQDNDGKPSNMRVMCNRASWTAFLFGVLSFGLLYLDKESAATQGFLYAAGVLALAHGAKGWQKGKEKT